MLIKVVGHYDVNVLSMSVMGFQNKVWIWVCGWGALSSFILDFLNLFNFAKPFGQNVFCDTFMLVIPHFTVFVCQIEKEVGRCDVLWKAYKTAGSGGICMRLVNPVVSRLTHIYQRKSLWCL